MQLIRGLHNLRPLSDGCVATIGNFDGVHLGHQAIFKQLAEQGGRLGLPVYAERRKDRRRKGAINNFAAPLLPMRRPRHGGGNSH